MASLHQFHERDGGSSDTVAPEIMAPRNFHASRMLSVILDSMVKMAS
jgi:hypothetical protein